MKITIDIDCTPKEARAFFGLPDMAPLQAEMMKELQERMMKSLADVDAEKLMKTWLSSGAQTLEQMQRAFWEQFAARDPKGSTPSGSAPSGSSS
jgi:deferrochelatase/peroxidase EfeB